jgi:hypothetical protein
MAVRLVRMDRFLVCSSHTGREPPSCYIIEATVGEEIATRYPVFADRPICKLPEERPEWLTDEVLAFTEAYHVHSLGQTEPSWLTTIVEHHANGDIWEWYVLEERPSGADTINHGELGTWRTFEIGSDIGGLPLKPGRWHVVAIEPAPHARVAAKIVIEPTIPAP